MSKSFHIQWVEANPSQLANEYYAQFFLLVRNGRIAYIGNSYHRQISELIPATMKASGLNPGNTKIYLGRVVEFAGLSDEDVKEIQQLLVYARKPLFNVAGKHNYVANGNLHIHNSGAPLFPRTIKGNSYGVFLSQRLAEGVYAVA